MNCDVLKRTKEEIEDTLNNYRLQLHPNMENEFNEEYYDRDISYLIRAESVSEARLCAMDAAYGSDDEEDARYMYVWLDPDYTSCEIMF